VIDNEDTVVSIVLQGHQAQPKTLS
jgi:hypothetical protein